MIEYLASLALVAIAQDTAQRKPYGVEIAFRSGHADRGFIINDRPVIQPVVWLSQSSAEFSVWTSFPLAETTERSRPEILELELVREHQWGKFTIGPAVRMFYYSDALNADRTHSLEGWLYLSYDVGPFRLFTNHSLDILTYHGAYFVDFGVESEGRVSPALELGGSLGAGWGSWRFNNAYAEVAKSTLDRISAAGWLNVYIKHFYVGPHFEFNTIVDRTVRAELLRPTYLLVRFTVGGEF